MLVDKIDTIIIQKTNVGQYSCDDVEMLEAKNKVIIPAWRDIICSVVQNSIMKSVVSELHDWLIGTIELEFSFVVEVINEKLMGGSRRKSLSPISSDASRRLTQMCFDLKEERYHHRQSITEARLISEYRNLNIVILDVDNEVITKIPALEEISIYLLNSYTIHHVVHMKEVITLRSNKIQCTNMSEVRITLQSMMTTTCCTSALTTMTDNTSSLKNVH